MGTPDLLLTCHLQCVRAGDTSPIAYLLTKLVNIGVFSTASPALAQPSFFGATLPTIRDRLSEESSQYALFWQKTLSSFSSSLTLHSILTALFASLSDIPGRLDVEPSTRAKVRREAMLLRELVGRPTKDNPEILDVIHAITLSRDWNEGHARIFACWFCGAQKDRVDAEGIRPFYPSAAISLTLACSARRHAVEGGRYVDRCRPHQAFAVVPSSMYVLSSRPSHPSQLNSAPLRKTSPRCSC